SGGRLFLPWHVGVCFPGSSPVTGPKAVRGQERGSLAVQCRYTPGWESHGKWWCRGADWGNCKILVQTTASEPEVKRDRVSIRDDRENRTFTVTTEELRLDDAGIYWCGIERVLLPGSLFPADSRPATEEDCPSPASLPPCPSRLPNPASEMGNKSFDATSFVGVYSSCAFNQKDLMSFEVKWDSGC
uniref:Immunoglobulin V-set domain-containing protein n=1 Tax=Sus scrofa TaxID=9823 RepID=A0A8D0V0A4_PIG